MTDRTCSVPGCDAEHKARGYCTKHYMIAMRAGKFIPIPNGKIHPGASYMAVHQWINYNIGKATTRTCVDCGEQAKDWSYVGGCVDEMVDPRYGPYCIHPEHFVPRCRPCHMEYDNVHRTKTHCKRGHEFTPENTVIRRDKRRGGALKRECRICANATARRSGRARLPIKNGQRKNLTEDQVREIRRLHAIGEKTMIELSWDFDVSYATVNAVVTRRSWKHIE